MNTTTHLATVDPALLYMAGAALLFGLMMASAKNFLGKLNSLAVLAVMAWMFHAHELGRLPVVIAYAVVSSIVLLGTTRRARA